MGIVTAGGLMIAISTANFLLADIFISWVESCVLHRVHLLKPNLVYSDTAPFDMT